MKIGLVSDVHAAPQSLRAALDIFAREHTDRIICTGDIAGYNAELSETIDLLLDNGVECIVGNHDQSYIESNPGKARSRDNQFLGALPVSRHYNFDGIEVHVVHAEPPDAQHGGIKLLDVDGRLIPGQVEHWAHALEDITADVLIVGHTHQVFSERLGGTLVINPGSTVYNHSCMILAIPELEVTTYALEGREIAKTWNWGMQVRNT